MLGSVSTGIWTFLVFLEFLAFAKTMYFYYLLKSYHFLSTVLGIIAMVKIIDYQYLDNLDQLLLKTSLLYQFRKILREYTAQELDFNKKFDFDVDFTEVKTMIVDRPPTVWKLILHSYEGKRKVSFLWHRSCFSKAGSSHRRAC